MNEIYTYDVSLSWLNDRKGLLESNVLNDSIEVVTPPEFAKGIPGIWSPEHLFVAAASSCFMTTFLAIAEKSRLEFTSFSCPATGILEKIDNKFIITTITLHPEILVKGDDMVAKGLKVLELSHTSCLILNSIKSKVVLMPKVIEAKIAVT